MKHSFLAAGVLVIAATAFGQSGPATNRPVPPAPPRTDAPGTPPNPRQNATAAPAAPAAAEASPVPPGAEAVATPAPGAVNPEAPAVEPAAPTPRAMRELVFADADTDKDGRVSLNEYTTFVESRMEHRSTETVREETIQRFLDLDQNNDAHLSQSEASTPPAPAVQPQTVPPPRVRR